MLKFRNLFFGTLLFLTFQAAAQNDLPDSSRLSQDRTHGAKYFSEYLSGGMISDNNSGTNFSFSTVHGAEFGRLGVGIGLSYDSYGQWSSVPVLAVFKAEIGKIKSSSVYLQLAGGYGKLWYKQTDDEYLNYTSKRSNKIEALLGYQIATEKLKVYITGGFRSQQLYYSQAPRWWFDSPNQSTVTRTINGLVLQLGVGF
jgi:hypothetical protein